MAKVILDNSGKAQSEIMVLKTYFGLQPEQKLGDFMIECKALSAEAKTELAIGASKELGWTIQD
jgi:hypothetical protein